MMHIVSRYLDLDTGLTPTVVVVGVREAVCSGAMRMGRAGRLLVDGTTYGHFPLCCRLG